MDNTNGDAARSDALVLFGVSGDLAREKIFPALYALAKRGVIDVPVVGVATSTWSSAQLRQRATESIEQSGPIDDRPALDRLLARLEYVSGDYHDAATFTAIKNALGSARHPAHYLAIPPALFQTVIQGLAAVGLADGARVVLEKPFGRDLASARAPRARRFRHGSSAPARSSWASSASSICSMSTRTRKHPTRGSSETPWPAMAHSSPARTRSRPPGRWSIRSW